MSVEFLLRVGRRRAQQIMAPCIAYHVGTNGLADRDRLITRLRHFAGGDDGYYEVQRRRQVASVIDRLRKERIERPQPFVEAQARIAYQQFENLPAGPRLELGRITVEFDNSQEALQKLLGLAMVIGNDSDCFERQDRCGGIALAVVTQLSARASSINSGDSNFRL